jgi:hypothetical protein
VVQGYKDCGYLAAIKCPGLLVALLQPVVLMMDVFTIERVQCRAKSVLGVCRDLVEDQAVIASQRE